MPPPDEALHYAREHGVSVQNARDWIGESEGCANTPVYRAIAGATGELADKINKAAAAADLMEKARALKFRFIDSDPRRVAIDEVTGERLAIPDSTGRHPTVVYIDGTTLGRTTSVGWLLEDAHDLIAEFHQVDTKLREVAPWAYEAMAAYEEKQRQRDAAKADAQRVAFEELSAALQEALAHASTEQLTPVRNVLAQAYGRCSHADTNDLFVQARRELADLDWQTRYVTRAYVTLAPDEAERLACVDDTPHQDIRVTENVRLVHHGRRFALWSDGVATTSNGLPAWHPEGGPLPKSVISVLNEAGRHTPRWLAQLALKATDADVETLGSTHTSTRRKHTFHLPDRTETFFSRVDVDFDAVDYTYSRSADAV